MPWTRYKTKTCRHCGKPTDLTEDEKKQIREFRQKNITYKKISEMLNVSRNSVWRAWKQIKKEDDVEQIRLFKE